MFRGKKGRLKERCKLLDIEGGNRGRI